MTPDIGRTATLSYTRVPREEWGRFFDEFSKQNVGSPMSVEVETPEEGRHELAHEAPLIGITASSEHGESLTIELIFSDSPAGELSHTIHSPSRVTVIPGAGESKAMEIESELAREVVVVRWREKTQEKG
jgi:hypothetical protein